MSEIPLTNTTAEEAPEGLTSHARIERVLHALRTRQTGHLSAAVDLINALRYERERRRTAMNVLAVLVALLLENDQQAPPKESMNPMRRALLESALERAVLALYPMPTTKGDADE